MGTPRDPAGGDLRWEQIKSAYMSPISFQPALGWMKLSWGLGGRPAAAMVWDAAGKAHPVMAGRGRALPVGPVSAKKGSLIQYCSVTNWKSGQQNWEFRITTQKQLAYEGCNGEELLIVCSYQVTGQTHVFLMCAVQYNILDDTKGFSVFVHKQILWICQAQEITQPNKQKQHTAGSWWEVYL